MATYKYKRGGRGSLYVPGEHLHEEKENKIIQSAVDFAASTEQFKNTGCYSKEFIKIGDKEVTLMVIDDNWVGLNKSEFEDLICYKRLYHMNL